MRCHAILDVFDTDRGARRVAWRAEGDDATTIVLHHVVGLWPNHGTHQSPLAEAADVLDNNLTRDSIAEEARSRPPAAAFLQALYLSAPGRKL